LTATLGIGDIHKLALRFFPRISHLRVASWVELWLRDGQRRLTDRRLQASYREPATTHVSDLKRLCKS